MRANKYHLLLLVPRAKPSVARFLKRKAEETPLLSLYKMSIRHYSHLKDFVYGEKCIGLIDFSYSHIIELCLMRKRKSIDVVTIRCIEAIDPRIGDGERAFS